MSMMSMILLSLLLSIEMGVNIEKNLFWEHQEMQKTLEDVDVEECID